MNCSYIAGLVVLLEVFHIVSSKGSRELSAPSGDDESSEPSCDELRKMWRHTKREMQQKTEVPMPRYKSSRYHEPFSYGWKAQARPRNAMKYSKPVYGRLVHSPDKFMYRNNIPDRFRSFDQVARMVGGGSSYYTPTLTAPAKPTFFRLEYPVRRPVLPVRISHIGRFHELQNILRNERAEDLQTVKSKDNTESNDSSGTNTDSTGSGYAAFPYQQSRVEEDDVTAVNSRGRKLRGTNSDILDEQSAFTGNGDEGSLSIDLSEDGDSISSTSKPKNVQEDFE
ncbi:uncharacterized protein LOC135836117 isoform X2 [Planococcus citri]|uniref:uncharacterized protein LOC135836117 isoform X2 n=1 Tax=Planococcus citri TaxID=170843 RepID=UPI0031F9D976